MGLGVMLSGATRVTDEMLTEAAVALSHYVDPGRLEQGGVYPPIQKIRSASKQVAIAVIKAAQQAGLNRTDMGEDIDAFVENHMWRPVYLPIRKVN
ncbi:MAG: malic enzyme-like NAD(P)-binding protein [Deinococcales bacterium]